MKFTSNDIRILRQSRNMQQKDIAVVMKISVQRYSVLENDEDRPIERTKEILKVLKYTFESARNFLNTIPPAK